MMKNLQTLNYYDLFGYNPNLNYFHKKNIQTNLGALLSICISKNFSLMDKVSSNERKYIQIDAMGLNKTEKYNIAFIYLDFHFDYSKSDPFIPYLQYDFTSFDEKVSIEKNFFLNSLNYIVNIYCWIKFNKF